VGNRPPHHILLVFPFLKNEFRILKSRFNRKTGRLINNLEMKKQTNGEIKTFEKEFYGQIISINANFQKEVTNVVVIKDDTVSMGITSR
jgi:hypothetical protein